jgi:quinolinate synthase
MAMNDLRNLADTLENMSNEIFVDEEVRKKAFISTQRLIEFNQA